MRMLAVVLTHANSTHSSIAAQRKGTLERLFASMLKAVLLELSRGGEVSCATLDKTSVTDRSVMVAPMRSEVRGASADIRAASKVTRKHSRRVWQGA